MDQDSKQVLREATHNRFNKPALNYNTCKIHIPEMSKSFLTVNNNSSVTCVYIVLLTSCTQGDGCICTTIGSSICFFCTYCIAIYSKIFSISICSIPNNACSFPQTTKKLQIFCLLLCSILFYACLIVLLLFGFTF